MVKLNMNIMDVKVATISIIEGDVVNGQVELRFDGHRNDEGVQRLVDNHFKGSNVKAIVLDVERTKLVYEISKEQFVSLAVQSGNVYKAEDTE